MKHSGPMMPRSHRCALLLCALVCTMVSSSSCTYHHSVQTTREWLHKTEFIDHHQLTRQQDWTLPASAAIFVAFPDSRHPQALDLRLQHTLAQQLGRHFPLLERGTRPQTFAAALGEARARGLPFMIYPRLLHFSDKADSALELNDSPAPETALGRDRLQVQLLIFDCVNRRMLETAVISSRSSWLAWQRRGPEDMLAPAFAKFARSLSAAPLSQYPSYRL